MPIISNINITANIRILLLTKAHSLHEASLSVAQLYSFRQMYNVTHPPSRSHADTVLLHQKGHSRPALSFPQTCIFNRHASNFLQVVEGQAVSNAALNLETQMEELGARLASVSLRDKDSPWCNGDSNFRPSR